MPDSPTPPAARLVAAPSSSLASILALITILMLPASAFASHNTDYFAAQLINGPGTTLPAYFEGSPFVLTHENSGTDLVNVGEPITCGAGGNVTHYGRTVYYEFHPNRNGRIRVVAASLTAGFRPVATWIPFQLGTGIFDPWLCNGSTVPINRATLPSEGYIPVVAGAHYKIQVSGENNPNDTEINGAVPTSGNFQLTFVYDPNSDGDPLFDSQDACPDNDGGPYSIAGCPDGDNDDVRDLDDQCDGQHIGARGIRGCPDTDGDGKVDSPDPGSDLSADDCDRNDSRPRDADDDGCLDLLRLGPTVKLESGVFCPGGPPCAGLKIKRIVVTDIPRGTKVAVSCTRRACRERPKKAKRGKAIIKINRNARKGTKVTVRVTKARAIGRRVTYTIAPNDWTRSSRCLRPGSRRALRCSPKLATRFDGSS